MVQCVRVAQCSWRSGSKPAAIPWLKAHGDPSPKWINTPGDSHGVACKRRVRQLYAGSKYFACRHCYRLTYTSSRETRADRALRRNRKILGRLGETQYMFVPEEKPKGMHWKTYDQLLDNYVEADREHWMSGFGRLGFQYPGDE